MVHWDKTADWIWIPSGVVRGSIDQGWVYWMKAEIIAEEWAVLGENVGHPMGTLRHSYSLP